MESILAPFCLYKWQTRVISCFIRVFNRITGKVTGFVKGVQNRLLKLNIIHENSKGVLTVGIKYGIVKP